jgi:hypothetical protein
MTKPKNINVDEMLTQTGHPLIDDVQYVRQVIKGIDPRIKEEWKWNAPSYSYEGHYLVTFNLWEQKRIHLVFHNPEIVNIESEILEGDYPTRRMAYFDDRREIEAKRPEIERVIRELIEKQ